MSNQIDREQFIEVFNDMDTYPTIQDVADYFGIKKAKVSQLANRYRGQDEPIINRRTKTDENSSGGVEQTSGESSITFYIDSDLNVRVNTSVNHDEIAQVLADNEYIGPDQLNDDFAVHLAFILISHEVTAQIISEYAGDD